ncbi:hypothetical protein ACMHYJ_02180 [Castellaniella hirudinis]|uniref:hypothetical protein n=1 Tax=Castellaniella hirudinis TaxID=1144617 RepID=UPI0039C19291
MGSLIDFPGLQGFMTAVPSIFTPARIECLAQANDVARKLRGLGYRVVAEDPFPDDGGPSIIQIDVSTVGTRSLQHLGGCSVRNTLTGVESTTIDGVRVVWQTVEAS